MDELDKLLPGEARRSSVHEAGHVVLALCVGGTVKQLVKVPFDAMPAALRNVGCGASVATDFLGLDEMNDPPRQLLVAMAGMAAEEAVFGKYDALTAAQDFENIKPNVLPPDEVRKFIDADKKGLAANRTLFDEFAQQIEEWMNGSSDVLPGDVFNQAFREKGIRAEDIEV